MRIQATIDRLPGFGKNGEVKIALCNEVLRELPFPEQCRFAAAVGYDSLELAPFTLSETPHCIPESEIQRIRRTAQEEGLEITGLHWLLVAPPGLSITSSDPAVLRKTKQVLLGLIDLCAELGGSVLVHGSPEQRMISADQDRSRVFARAVEIFREVARQAGDRGLVYCIEPLRRAETSFINNLQEARALVSAVGSPSFKTMFDSRSARASEPVPPDLLLKEWLPAGQIAHVHLNDSNSRGPGEGEDSFGEIVQVLLEHDYQGTVSIEPFRYEPDGRACAARSIGFIRGLIEALHRAR